MSILWEPQDTGRTAMEDFRHHLSRRGGRSVQNYSELYAWSIQEPAAFWSELWDYAGFVGEKGGVVLEEGPRFQEARWFSQARLNFARNILRHREDRPAIHFSAEGKIERTLTFQELYDQVASLQSAWMESGLKAGDVVAAFMPNMPETVVAMLAATATGATWSSTSPDFGVQGVVDRLGQIQPRILCISDGYFFKGKAIESMPRVIEIIQRIPSIEEIFLAPLVKAASPDALLRQLQKAPELSGRQLRVRFTEACLSSRKEVTFFDFSFQHPVYIMYSSGTTGLPKCMVQGPGVLLNHFKEHLLHGDLKSGDTIFYYTTCGWMMWNWLVSALGLGATIMLFDGNPFTPDADYLWRWTHRHAAGTFGTSARYLLALKDQGFQPSAKLEHLQAVLSTGSPLPESGFEYVYRNIKSNLRLSSISGGTDLNGCFALGNPVLPVRSGEIQCLGLGMQVEIFDPAGKSVQGQRGELVCRKPFPSMPLYFWNDPDGKKYEKAYFARFPGVWCHGDFAELTDSGGLVVYGRSDATLNPGGVRIGTADIYSIVETFPSIEDSVVIGQPYADDVRVILFVKMRSGQELSDTLRQQIKQKLRAEASPRHVPELIIAVPDIPYTLNMKKVELAVKNAILGEEILNQDALINPQSLEYFRTLDLS